MPDNYYYHKDLFSNGNILELQQQEMHHLVHVMRCKKMQHVQLINGQGQLALACVANIGRHSVELQILDVKTQAPHKKSTILIQALTRPQKLELIIEKTVELGIDEIILFSGDRSEIKTLSPSQWHRLEAVIISAMKQSGRLHSPVYSMIEGLSKLPPLHVMYFFGDVNPLSPCLLSSLSYVDKDSVAAWICGPEKGFSENEYATLTKLAAKGCSLSPHILRAETAAIAGASIITSYKVTHNK
jgi:16S rRNA (uracil1498-N3)-methyltransferase